MFECSVCKSTELGYQKYVKSVARVIRREDGTLEYTKQEISEHLNRNIYVAFSEDQEYGKVVYSNFDVAVFGLFHSVYTNSPIDGDVISSADTYKPNQSMTSQTGMVNNFGMHSRYKTTNKLIMKIISYGITKDECDEMLSKQHSGRVTTDKDLDENGRKLMDVNYHIKNEMIKNGVFEI